MKITPLGDSAVSIELSDAPEKVRSLCAALEEQKMPGIWDIVPSYCTVAVFYDPLRFTRDGAVHPFDAVCTWLRGVEKSVQQAKPVASREHVIPVCYEGACGPDLKVLAEGKALSVEEVVLLHSGARYEVRAVGFSPGFPYLSGLPEKLWTPRRDSPRNSVPAGSVGIGGEHTGIYTLDTPGGWNLVGRTPIRLFRPDRAPPALLRAGDRLRFRRITLTDFESWKEES